MYLTMTSTAPDATSLGYLLHKHPERVQSFSLPVGIAHVFYPEATDRRCTVALLLEVDPIELVRGKRFAGDGFALSQYVNDRPYAASSMLAVALGRVFGTALRGECAARPELVTVPLPLTARIPAVPCSGGAELAGALFGPLGWSVTARTEPLDPQITGLGGTAWGDSRYVDLTLTAAMTVAEALSHIYVLLPVLDGAKHYWVDAAEVDKLMTRAGSWLRTHPQRELIAARYLAHQRSYLTDASERLAALDDAAPSTDIDGSPDGSPGGSPDGSPDGSSDGCPDADPAAGADGDPIGVPRSLVQHRKSAVVAALRQAGAHRIVDLGCGEGTLLRELLTDRDFTEIVGVDVSARELERAARRLDLDRLPDSQRARISLLQSSATYRDRRLAGYDAVVLMEVIEHLDVERLPALERSVFQSARPATVVVTTPNAEYNALYQRLTPGTMRHPDHRFEWSRAEFAHWASHAAAQHGYRVEHRPVGEVDPDLGPPTQLALFHRLRGAGR
ncbi:MAG: 3' terminal RNA ribose 2'-O-methyltransferase Hen1 [Nakamurella sp.]